MEGGNGRRKDPMLRNRFVDRDFVLEQKKRKENGYIKIIWRKWSYDK